MATVQETADVRAARMKKKSEAATKATASALDREKLQGSVLGGRKDTSGAASMPKQTPGESPAAYGKRLREWRKNKARQEAMAKPKKE
jgi:hypothetical protein